MVPVQDEASFNRDIANAIELARAGLVRIGYRTLDEALSHVEDLPPSEWAEELSSRYRRALAQYARAYGIRFPIPAEWEHVVPAPPVEMAVRLVEAARELLSAAAALQAESERLRVTAQAVRARSLAAREARRLLPDPQLCV
jgi:Lon protease-like protein